MVVPPPFAMTLARGPAFRQQRSVMTSSAMMVRMKESMDANPVAWWLFGCAGLLASTLTVGAASRLTRSGASMLYWVPQEYPPHSEDEWRKEFDVYSDFAHRHQRKPMVTNDLGLFHTGGSDCCVSGAVDVR
jgi:hypothetical protein